MNRIRGVGHLHPVNRELIDAAPLGVRIADRVTGFMSSWAFTVIRTALVIARIAGTAWQAAAAGPTGPTATREP